MPASSTIAVSKTTSQTLKKKIHFVFPYGLSIQYTSLLFVSIVSVRSSLLFWTNALSSAAPWSFTVLLLLKEIISNSQKYDIRWLSDKWSCSARQMVPGSSTQYRSRNKTLLNFKSNHPVWRACVYTKKHCLWLDSRVLDDGIRPKGPSISRTDQSARRAEHVC